MTDHTRRAAILLELRAWDREYGHWPTYRQLAATVGASSTSIVAYELQRLERLGALRRCRCGCRRLVLP